MSRLKYSHRSHLSQTYSSVNRIHHRARVNGKPLTKVGKVSLSLMKGVTSEKEVSERASEFRYFWK